MASIRGSGSRRVTESECPIDYVQMDGLVVLKMIKHCQEEVEVAQGVLVGLAVDNRLEITNSFPFPRSDNDEDFDEQDYQIDMMRYLRDVNIDHLQVGWYQSIGLASHLNKMLDSQFLYQSSIQESVVIVYDHQKTTRGFLSVRAFRLSPIAMQLYKDSDFTVDNVKLAHLRFDSFLEEIQVVIKNSHLINALLCELGENNALQGCVAQQMDLATSSVLKKGLTSLMDTIDELCQESNKFVMHQRQVVKQQANRLQHQQKRTQENIARQARGEAPLPEEDLNKLFKPLPPHVRLDSMVAAGQVHNNTQQVNQFASQALGKLFVAGGLQVPNLSSGSRLGFQGKPK